MPRYPGAKFNLVTRGQRARRATVKAFCMHSQEGNGDLTNWFRTSNRGPTHFQIRKDGSVIQFVDTSICVFANGWDGKSSLSTPLTRSWGSLANDVTVSCELEGYAGQPMNAAQLEAAVKLVAWVMKTHNLGAAKYEVNLFRHYHFAATACDSNRWPHTEIVRRVNEGGATQPVGKPTLDTVRNFWFGGDNDKLVAYAGLKWQFLTDLANRIDKGETLSNEELWGCLIDNAIRADLGLPWSTAWD